MQLQIFATVLASLAGSLVLADSTTGSVSGCSDISLNNYWLIANCTNDAGSLVSSGVYLPLHIANDNEVLTWKENGDFDGTCKDCSLSDSSVLTCTCGSTSAVVTSLNLEEHIANYDGHLLSNLEGTPTVPANASIPVPSNLELFVNFYDETSDCSDVSSTDANYSPVNCKAVLGTYDITFLSMSASLNEGWSLVAYDNSDCSGTPLGTIDLDNVNTCVAVDGATYLSMTPLWNWD